MNQLYIFIQPAYWYDDKADAFTTEGVSVGIYDAPTLGRALEPVPDVSILGNSETSIGSGGLRQVRPLLEVSIRDKWLRVVVLPDGQSPMMYQLLSCLDFDVPGVISTWPLVPFTLHCRKNIKLVGAQAMFIQAAVHNYIYGNILGVDLMTGDYTGEGLQRYTVYPYVSASDELRGGDVIEPFLYFLSDVLPDFDMTTLTTKAALL